MSESATKPVAVLGYLPESSGDGYSFGGGAVLFFAGRAIVLGEGTQPSRIGKHIVEAINAYKAYDHDGGG